jgi:hypothetical protein
MFPRRNILKFTSPSPDGKAHSKMYHVLRDKRRHYNILYVGLFRGTDCDTDHNLVVAKVRERLAVSKQTHATILYGEFQPQEIERGRG